jgi:hypothetical protein
MSVFKLTEEEKARGLIVPIKATRVGAVKDVFAIDPTIKVEYYWGKGTHGEARITGRGKFLIVDISSRGNHRCALCELREDSVLVLEQTPTTKFCLLCEKYVKP